MTEGQGPTQSRMRCPDHPEQKAGSCAECFKAAVPRADLCPVPRRSKHLPTPCEMCGRAQRHDHRRYGCNPEHHEPMEES